MNLRCSTLILFGSMHEISLYCHELHELRLYSKCVHPRVDFYQSKFLELLFYK